MVQQFIAFEFKSPNDVLEKLKRELDRFKSDYEKQKDHAFNFAVTSNAMADWIWHCWIKDNQERRNKYLPKDKVKTRDGRTFFKARRDECKHLKLCYVLGNSAKHVVPNRKLDLKNSIVSTSTQIVEGTEDKFFIPRKFRFLTQEEEKIDARIVFENTLKFWNSLVKEICEDDC